MSLRTVLLGSAAVIASGAAVRAADLPIAEPVEYVRICDAFGTGFYYIPGTDTCLRLTGLVRAEAHYVDGDPDVFFGDGTVDTLNSQFNNFTTRSRARTQFDARTSTSIGLVRSYIEWEFTIGPTNYTEDYTTEVEMNYAYVEVTNDLGMFTAGRQDSFFDFWGSDDYGSRIDIDDNTTEQNLFAYTFSGPSGLTATLSVEDPKTIGRRLSGVDDYEGQELPDLVGNIAVEQAWGSAQIMGVARHIHDKEDFPFPGCDAPPPQFVCDAGEDGDGIGWAAGAGASFNLPHGITFSTQVGYADGALAYITTDPGGIGDFSGPTGDETNQAWMGRGGFNVPFTDKFTAWFDGSFTHAEDTVFDDEYDYWAVVVGGAWAPNDRLSMGPEVGFNQIDGDDPGEDGDLWGVMWRMELAF